MATRKPLSKRTRFEVFKRDDFQCRYCGARAPSVLLHIDHVVAIANGGTNSIENLISACETCNLGKAARPLGDKSPPIPQSAAETLAGRAEQLEAYRQAMSDWIEQQQSFRDDLAVAVYNAIWGHEDPGKMLPVESAVQAVAFVERLGFKKVLDLASVTGRRSNQFYSWHKAWKYFCGCCWRAIREHEESVELSGWDDGSNPGAF